MYALQAIHRATAAEESEDAIAQEREWQYAQLVRLREGV